MPRRRVILVVVLALIVAAVLGRGLLVETSAGCAIDPRTAPELRFLDTAATGAPPLPVSSPRANPYPEYPWVDTEPLASVNELLRTMREVNACRAAGDLPRLYALYTDAFLDRTVRLSPGSTTDDPAGSSTRHQDAVPDPAVWRGSWQLPDGRVGAAFSRGYLTPSPDPDPPVYFVFVNAGDRWLIDDAVPFAN